MGYNMAKKEMKRFAFLITTLLFLSGTAFSQTKVTYDGLKLSEFESQNQQSSNMKSYSFTRGRGFFIRPEFYRGLFATCGYQFNPYLQTFLSAGYGDDITFAAGVRVYTNDNNGAGMIDTRAGLNGYGYILSLVGGASYKDWDFGIGGMAYIDVHQTWLVPVISVGWNYRCYQHQ